MNFGNDISNVNNWKPVAIDPFNYSTQSQVAMNFFLAGKEPHTTAAISTIKHRQNFSAISIIWLEQMSKTLNIPIQHIGNSEKEYFDQHTKRYLDGFSKYGNKVFSFMDAFFMDVRNVLQQNPYILRKMYLMDYCMKKQLHMVMN